MLCANNNEEISFKVGNLLPTVCEVILLYYTRSEFDENVLRSGQRPVFVFLTSFRKRLRKEEYGGVSLEIVTIIHLFKTNSS